MKTKITALFTIVILVLSLAACGGNTDTQITQSQPDTSATQNQPDETTGTAAEPVTNTGKTLVVYFSATGTTKGVAEKIAKVTNADIYEIKAAQTYTDADLNWHDSSSRTTKEQNDKTVRPEIASEKLNLDGYTTIYIGYPIWWGEEPRIMDTFAESYDFDGITIIPFCTSGGSGIGRSGKNIEENAGSGTWLNGERLSSGISEAELQTWIDSLQ